MSATNGSMKVVLDRAGHPWLVVGVEGGEYEAVELEVVSRRRFRRSWQAIDFVRTKAWSERAAAVPEGEERS